MAHQYSAAPSYGAQYQATPYHPPFPPSTGQQSGSNTAAFQQMNIHHQNAQSPSNVPNTARYDTNAQVYPQATPLPFAPQFYPEFLKHFPPPPPSLLASRFTAAPGTATGFAHFPTNVGTPPLPMAHQSYSQFPQSSTPSNILPPTQDPNTYGRMKPSNEAESTIDPIHNISSAAQAATNAVEASSTVAQPLEGTNSSHSAAQVSEDVFRKKGNPTQLRLEGPRGYVVDARNIDAKPQLHTDNRGDGLKPASQSQSQSQLRERAKAALLSLIPHNIRYSDFLAEGVNALTLQELYDELGLSWRPHEEKQAKQNPDKAAVVTQPVPTQGQPASNMGVGPSSSKAPHAATSLPLPSSTINSSMERKDRIAQLLAIKAGKTTASGATSKSGSPSSVTESIHNSTQDPADRGQTSLRQQSRSTRAVAHTDLLRQSMEELNKRVVVGVSSSEQGLPLNTNRQVVEDKRIVSTTDPVLTQSNLLPTPIKEKLTEAGLASLIPGLFMTSTETEENNEARNLFGQQNVEEFASVPTASLVGKHVEDSVHVLANSGQNSLKRPIPADQYQEVEQPEAKRHAIQPGNSRDTKSDEDTVEQINDDASEGEIIEDDHVPPHTQTSPAHDQAEFQDQIQAAKQPENDDLRKRLMDTEQRQNLRHNPNHTTSPTGSAVATPTISQVQRTASGSLATKSMDHVNKAEERACQSPIALVKATPEQIAERAAQLKADFLRQRALRQRQLQEGVPALDDEVVKSQDKLKVAKEKLAQVRREAEQYEENVTRVRNIERQILQEVETLEKQISESTSGRKQFSNELKKLKQQANGGALHPIPVPVSIQTVTSDVDLQTSHAALSGPSSESSQKPYLSEQHHDRIEPQESNLQLFAEPNTERSPPSTSFESEILSTNQVTTGLSRGSGASNQNGLVDEFPPLVDGTSELSDAMNPLARAREESKLSDKAMEEFDSETGDSHMSIDEESDDSASMSDSGSEDYEPAESQGLPRLEQQSGPGRHEPDVETVRQRSELEEGEEEEEGAGDDYEPADDMSISSGSSTTSTSAKYQTPSNTNLSNQDQQSNEGQQKSHPITQISSVAEETRNDDQEKGLQLSEANTLTKAQNLPEDARKEEQHVLGEEEAPRVHYVPYQSPLSAFKSYRFNPSFKDQTKDGYRSLTYSHKIDPSLPICPMELDGNACTDPECQNQHFHSMALTDDKILVQMSSATDIKDKALRDQYLLGLKQVIAKLRLDGVKEFPQVAAALSRYRRDWTATHVNS